VKYWSKIADCKLLHIYFSPPFGVTPLEFRQDLWHQKNRVPELLCGITFMMLHLAVLVQYQRVTDRQMEGHTMMAYTMLA